jgi:uracil-DNA glycosylase family 4
MQREIQQLLRDWQSAGVTHWTRPADVPRAADPGDSSVNAESESALQPTHKQEAEPPMPRMESVKPVPSKTLAAETDDRIVQLKQLADQVAACVRCQELATTRTQTVFGVGDPHARVMFIGEAPGADEDKQGEPFVGKAGQLLNDIIKACGWKREELYICNILRCRPPGNRTPSKEEAGNCREYLDAQIAIVDPEYIVCWGACAAGNLLDSADPIGKMRKKWFHHGRAKVLCTYHPSYLLRNPSAKKDVWEDMKFLLKEMGLEVPGKN